jgi:hypothetical protein
MEVGKGEKYKNRDGELGIGNNGMMSTVWL